MERNAVLAQKWLLVIYYVVKNCCYTWRSLANTLSREVRNNAKRAASHTCVFHAYQCFRTTNSKSLQDVQSDIILVFLHLLS